MFDSTTFQQNIHLLALMNPPFAEKINLMSPFKSSLEPPSRKEIAEWFNSLNLNGINILYVYGIGSYDTYEVIKPWLKVDSNRGVVFLEDDFYHFYQLLGTSEAACLLNDLQVDIRDVSQAETDRVSFRLMTRENMLRPATITAIPSYLNGKSAQFEIIRDLITYESLEQNVQNKELSNFGMAFFRNFYKNILDLPLAYDGLGMSTKFKNIPAIICGAGPSLLKQIPHLKELQNKALIFAPSSAQNILTSHGVWPHFGVVLDPSPETFHRQYMQRGFETPIFYQNRIFTEALSTIHGPKIFMPNDTVYLIEDWFEEQLGLVQDSMVGGYNSIHTSMMIAQKLGCNPIIFVGLELSKSTDEHYSSGIENHPLFSFADEKGLGNPIRVKDIYGKEVTSYWRWIAEAQWIDWFNRLNPTMTLINATEAGIGFFSVPHQPLAEVAPHYLNKDYDLNLLVHQAIQAAGLIPVTLPQIRDSLEIFLQSLKRCLECCLQIHKILLTDTDEERSLLEKKLKKELGYQYLLIQMEEFFLKFIQKDLRNLKRIKDTVEQDHKKRQLDESLYQFLIQATELNLQMIAMVLIADLSQKSIQNSRHEELDMPQPSDAEKSVRLYYPSGALYALQSFEKELRHGKHLYYYPEGSIKSEINYSNGQLNGPSKLYYPTGKLKREMSFIEGQREGIESSWYENGQKFTEVDYHHNTPKHAKCWNLNGTLAKDITC